MHIATATTPASDQHSTSRSRTRVTISVVPGKHHEALKSAQPHGVSAAKARVELSLEHDRGPATSLLFTMRSRARVPQRPQAAMAGLVGCKPELGGPVAGHAVRSVRVFYEHVERRLALAHLDWLAVVPSERVSRHRDACRSRFCQTFRTAEPPARHLVLARAVVEGSRASIARSA